METEVEAGMGRMWPHAQGCWNPKKLEEAGRSLPWSLWREHRPAWTSDIWSPELGDSDSCDLSLPACGH